MKNHFSFYWTISLIRTMTNIRKCLCDSSTSCCIWKSSSSLCSFISFFNINSV